MYHRMYAKFIHAEMELNKDRKEILEQLRDPKKDLLLELLENNVNSTRRLRALKECFLGRMARNELEPEECGCDCDCDKDDEDEDEEIFIHDDAEETEESDEDEDEDEACDGDDACCILTEEQMAEIEHHKCLSALVDGDKE